MSAPTPTEHVSQRVDTLRADWGLPGKAVEQVDLLAASSKSQKMEPRGDLVDVGTVIRQVIDLARELSGCVALALWAQALFTRRIQDQVLVARVAEMLRERGLYDEETVAIKRAAVKELTRLGMSGAKAEAAANKVVEALAAELPPVGETVDAGAVSELVARVKDWSAHFPAWEFAEQGYGCRVKVPVSRGGGRRVHVLARRKDEFGHPVVEFVAFCGRPDPARLEDVLRRGGQLELGNFALRRAGGADFFVLQHRMRLAEVNEAALQRVIPYLAEHADEMTDVTPGVGKG